MQEGGFEVSPFFEPSRADHIARLTSPLLVQFELLKPLARKASLERRRSTDALGSNADEQLQPPKSVVPRRSASAETPTLKPLLETDEFGFYLRPGKKATKPQGGPSGEESRALEAKWVRPKCRLVFSFQTSEADRMAPSSARHHLDNNARLCSKEQEK